MPYFPDFWKVSMGNLDIQNALTRSLWLECGKAIARVSALILR